MIVNLEGTLLLAPFCFKIRDGGTTVLCTMSSAFPNLNLHAVSGHNQVIAAIQSWHLARVACFAADYRPHELP
jgi:hypothetical protein